MDLRALKYFVTAAEEMNMTRAAERLGMSQPPLSSQIKNLEDELHVQLLIRGKRSLKMTDAGEMLYRRAKQILELAEQTKLEMESLEGLKGSINISIPPCEMDCGVSDGVPTGYVPFVERRRG